MQENKIISQHLLKLKEKTWELQIIHISTTNLMMHSYCYSEREGAHKISFIREMKAHNFQLPILWRRTEVSCIYKNYFEQVSFESNLL